MLKRIDPVISPELLFALARMGHGDEIVLADAHFPGYRLNSRVIDASGVTVEELLQGIMPLFVLDSYTKHPLIMMSPFEDDELDSSVEKSYRQAIGGTTEGTFIDIVCLKRYAFYERAAEAFAVVMTGSTVKYGNIILRKGVTPV